jgi:chemotaxis family two-component system response regulator Rcp1
MRILLVEDLDSDAVLLREALRDSGLGDDLICVGDGQEALDLLHSGGPLPQLVLLDLNLPGVSGREVLRDIRSNSRLQELPVVVLTTSISPGDVADAYRNHANAYVRKPNGFAALASVASAIRDFWLRTATLPSAFPQAS